jgi:hypothetical protein
VERVGRGSTLIGSAQNIAFCHDCLSFPNHFVNRLTERHAFLKPSTFTCVPFLYSSLAIKDYETVIVRQRNSPIGLPVEITATDPLAIASPLVSCAH